MNENRYMDAAQRMNLLHVGVGAGTVFWKPAGLRMYEALRRFIRDVHERHGYQEVKTPSLASVHLFERSGHLGRYRENMFFCNQENDLKQAAPDSGYALRPMSCPNHIELYSSSRRSYRELPMALFEFGEVFRNEADGALQVLFRQRQFCQDDSHVFAMEEQVAQVARNYLEMAREVYEKLGFTEVEYALSLRPEQRFGDDALWDRAEGALQKACADLGLPVRIQPGEGAFYGPKIELGVRDKLGRLWQLGTLQLDYVLPRRFDMQFQASSGEYEVPVILHHAVLGSLERMVGILLEVHGVNVPDFLHPHPIRVVPVSDKSLNYAKKVAARLRANGHVELDAEPDPLGAKLKRGKQAGVLALYVVGEQEAQAYADSGVMRANVNRADGSREQVELS